MPKYVDHQQRKEQIAQAAWRIIRREGLSGVSVRRVAEESGLSLGSLRHYFETQAELLTFAMQLVSERVNRRIDRLPFSGDPRKDMELVIHEIMPLHEESQEEAEVWLAFAGTAVSDPTVRGLSLEVHQQLYSSFLRIMQILMQQGHLPKDTDPIYEARRLHALVDGLVLHRTLYPDQLSREELVQTVSRHLAGMLSQGPSN